MAMRREGELQGDLLMTWAEMPRAPGHVFYDRLQALLSEAGFDACGRPRSVERDLLRAAPTVSAVSAYETDWAG
jgi:hypothetical protein